MPGVADVERRTALSRERAARQVERKELLRMVGEGRIHEADERQLETIKLALELNDLLEQKRPTDPPSTNGLAEAVAQAIADGFANVTVVGGVGSGVSSTETERPGMKHVSLTDLGQTREELDIQGELEGEEKTVEDGASKREQLKRLKGDH